MSLIEHMQRIDVISNSLPMWWLGQLGVALKGPDAVVYIDPYLQDNIVGEKNSYPVPVQPEQVTNATYVLITHEHLDHLDTVTLEPLAKASPNARFVTNGWCKPMLMEIGIAEDRILTPEALKPITLPDTSLRVTVVPAAHYVKEYDPQKGYRWIGFLLEWNGVTLYHSGDTIIYDDYIDTLRKLPTPDVVIIPTNGRDTFRDQQNIIGNLWPREATQLAQMLNWGLVIPAHNDMLKINNLPHAQVAAAFFEAGVRFKMLQPGELYYYVT